MIWTYIHTVHIHILWCLNIWTFVSCTKQQQENENIFQDNILSHKIYFNWLILSSFYFHFWLPNLSVNLKKSDDLGHLSKFIYFWYINDTLKPSCDFRHYVICSWNKDLRFWNTDYIIYLCYRSVNWFIYMIWRENQPCCAISILLLNNCSAMVKACLNLFHNCLTALSGSDPASFTSCCLKCWKMNANFICYNYFTEHML